MLDFKDKLNFSDVDMIPPENIVKEVADKIEAITDGYIKAVVQPYDGHIQSYVRDTNPFAGLTMGLGSKKEEYDIQNDLGKRGYKYSKYEVYLTATSLPNYKYRVFFFGYGIGGYPVTVVIEQGIAEEAKGKYQDTFTIKNRADLTELVEKVFTTQRTINVMQGLINATMIERSKKQETDFSEPAAE